jgi:hypothetical protein
MALMSLGTWDSTNPYIGPVVGAHTNLTEIDLTMDLLWRNNIGISDYVPCTQSLPDTA